MLPTGVGLFALKKRYIKIKNVVVVVVAFDILGAVDGV